MPISLTHKAIFIHIPKTGGQSVSQMIGLKQYENVSTCYWGVKDGLVLTHLTISQLKSRFDISGFYVFAFVRDPYTRILSEYNWRMRNRAAFEEPTGSFMGFVDYCELLHSKWERLMNDPDMNNVKITNIQHVRPQSGYVDDDVEIYRYENFTNECLRVRDRLGISRDVQKRNVGSYNTQHTDRTIEITNELYADDFRKFGYSMTTK